MLATFLNGLVVEYIPGDNIQSVGTTSRESKTRIVSAPLTLPLPPSMQSIDIRGRLSEIIASEMAHFHKADFPSTDTDWLWLTLERYYASVVSEYGQFSVDVKGVGSFSLDDIAAEIQHAKATLSQSTLPIVCSHNDINYQNILYDAPSRTTRALQLHVIVLAVVLTSTITNSTVWIAVI